ncbi:hypothetical protein TNCV_994561 [Trichonephila clavipes]|nr:hypothetical protein TNCV_994561 [Trichonephila clavipes]
MIQLFVQATPGTLFRNVRPHVPRGTFKTLNGIGILPWPPVSTSYLSYRKCVDPYWTCSAPGTTGAYRRRNEISNAWLGK